MVHGGHMGGGLGGRYAAGLGLHIPADASLVARHPAGGSEEEKKMA